MNERMTPGLSPEPPSRTPPYVLRSVAGAHCPAEMQLHMMNVSEEYGGLGLSHIDQAAIVEQIAWADAGVAVTLNGNGLALKPVLVAGNEEQKQKCCDIIVNGGWCAVPPWRPYWPSMSSRTSATSRKGLREVSKWRRVQSPPFLSTPGSYNLNS